MTTVLTDNELLALYDRWDHVPGAPDTGIGVDMGVEGERRAMWAARAAYVEAHRALNVAILQRHEGRLARALEAREVRGWLDAMTRVLGMVKKPAEAKSAGKGKVWWGTRFPSELRDGELPDTGFLRGWLIPIGGWEWGACGRKGVAYTEAEARTALLTALRADGWEVPEDEAKPAREWREGYYTSTLIVDGRAAARCWLSPNGDRYVWCWQTSTSRGDCATREEAKFAAEKALENPL